MPGLLHGEGQPSQEGLWSRNSQDALACAVPAHRIDKVNTGQVEKMRKSILAYCVRMRGVELQRSKLCAVLVIAGSVLNYHGGSGMFSWSCKGTAFQTAVAVRFLMKEALDALKEQGLCKELVNSDTWTWKHVQRMQGSAIRESQEITVAKLKAIFTLLFFNSFDALPTS